MQFFKDLEPESMNMLMELQVQLEKLKSNSEPDLLISVSKAERQEARMKVRHHSLRLGNVGVIRAGTVIFEAWEDGQAIKDVNAHLRRLLELREVVERQRKSLKKKQPDKGDGSEGESGLEEDVIIQHEIYKSRLASIKCVSSRLTIVPFCNIDEATAKAMNLEIFYGIRELKGITKRSDRSAGRVGGLNPVNGDSDAKNLRVKVAFCNS
ncbi:hypothetical protein E3N88_39698 [Mikania micrantha]|uniref:Uncharacterized protein n=1 Tax=Mikania micrantha TaxID=192012 RepID=A0A5N6LLE8_9ASTR|nr:hypothetical protein E3N88_39698 [Mikania micrantha]